MTVTIPHRFRSEYEAGFGEISLMLSTRGLLGTPLAVKFEPLAFVDLMARTTTMPPTVREK
jgi:hypothetical protein